MYTVLIVGAPQETWTVIEWQYRKIDLNQLPRKTDEIDVLCDAGEEGWELVTILPNNVAYLKRELDEMASEGAAPESHASTLDAKAVSNGAGATAGNGYEVKVKYRDPKTSETWSGRGRMANWLKRKQDAGDDIEKYRV
jgi:DNA-binding protein H-NS